MSAYELRTRNLNGIIMPSNYEDELRKMINEHHRNGWIHRNAVIVSTENRVIGFKIRVLYGFRHSILPHWVPYCGLEMFGLFFQVSAEYHDFADKIVYDPLGEYPVGASVKKIAREIERKQKADKRKEAHS